MKKKNDRGMSELLALLKAHPELIRDLVFDPNSIMRVLRSKAARRLVRGQSAQEFLLRMANPADGYPVAQCYKQTKVLCGKGTVVCVGNTNPVPACTGNTNPRPVCVGNTNQRVS